MTTEIFNLFDAINREGIDNGSWGLCQDIENTAEYFGTVEAIELQGQFVYLYREADESFSFIQESKCGKPTHTLTVEDSFIDLYKL